MRLTFALALLLALPAFAQDRDGNDTPGEWVVDHHRAFGLWDSMCDHRVTGDQTEQRCYLRYVDVFSPRPQFGAQFFFLTPGPEIEFGLEAGTLFPPDGFRIVSEGQTTWSAPQPGCLVGLACLYDQDDAATLLEAMAAGGSFKFTFTDRHGQPQNLEWSLSRFADAVADFNAQSGQRGL